MTGGEDGENELYLRDTSSTKREFSTPAIAFAAVAVILIVAVPLTVLLNGGSKRRGGRAFYPVSRQAGEEKPPTSGRLQPPDEGRDNRRVDTGAKDITVEQVERIAAQFMRRISNDDRPYVFPSYAVGALGDISKRVEQYAASPSTAGALNSVKSAGSEIAAAARREGLEPGLVIYTALAETDGGRAGNDHIGAARRVLPELLSLRKTLGTESVDKSLILLAAYRVGGGTKKSHPLLGTMRRVVKNPLTDRNVWYLREHGGLDEQSYEFIVRFIALGIIGENPRKFGVAAAPLAF